jgi:hypothetical protein
MKIRIWEDIEVDGKEIGLMWMELAGDHVLLQPLILIFIVCVKGILNVLVLCGRQTDFN